MILLWALDLNDNHVVRSLNWGILDDTVADSEVYGIDAEGNLLDKNGEIISSGLSPAISDSRSSSQESVAVDQTACHFSIPPKFPVDPLESFYARPENRGKYEKGWLDKLTGIFSQSDPTGVQYADENCRGGGGFISAPVDRNRYMKVWYPKVETWRELLPR